MPEGRAGSVLFRALEPIAGIPEMERARGLEAKTGARAQRMLTSGPGRLAEAFGITRVRDNGKDMTSDESDLIVATDNYRPQKILATARIGITKAADIPLRFLISGNEYVSGKKT
jgi:DNA-3-methyladenine glycosylase